MQGERQDRGETLSASLSSGGPSSVFCLSVHGGAAFGFISHYLNLIRNKPKFEGFITYIPPSISI